MSGFHVICLAGVQIGTKISQVYILRNRKISKMQPWIMALALLPGISLAVPALASASDTKVFNVLDYGAKPDGSGDAQGAIRKAVTDAESWTNPSSDRHAIVKFPAGTFSLEKPSDIFAIPLDHARNITLRGEDCTNWQSTDCTRLIGAPASTNPSGAPLYNTFFHITDSQNIKIENFYLDKKIPYFIQGRVETTDSAPRTLVVSVDPGFMNFSDSLAHALNIMMVFTNPDTPYWDHGRAACSSPAVDQAASENCHLFHVLSAQKLTGQKWELTLDKDPPSSFLGKPFLVWKNVGWQPGMLVSQTSNFSASHIFYTGGGGPAVHVQQSDGDIVLQDFVVDVPTGSGRLFAATSGFNGSANRGKIIIDHAVVRHTDDDAFHFSAGPYFPVLDQNSARIRVDLCYPGQFKDGDEIAAWDWASKTTVGSAHVLSATPVLDVDQERYHRTCDLTLDHSLPPLRNLRTYSEKNLGAQNDKNDRIVNLSLHPVLTVTNSYLSSMRARCGIIQVSAIVTHNVCANTPAAGFLIGPEYAWGEGYAVDGVNITYNKFDNIGGTAILIADTANSIKFPDRREMLAQPNAAPQNSDNANIVVEHNEFRNLGMVSYGIMGIKGAAVTVANAKNVSISGNTLSSADASASLSAESIVISPFSTRNVTH